MSVIHQERENRLDARLLMPLVLLALALGALFLRLWYLQVADSPRLAERAKKLRTREVSHLAPRGLIVDREGRLLAGVRPEIVITAIPAVISENPESLHRASALLGVSAQRLKRRAEAGAWRPHFPTPIHIGATIQAATRIAEGPDAFPGLAVSSLPVRTYPDSVSFAHVLGYVGTPSERDVARLQSDGIRPADFVGKLGLEYVYEHDLMGIPGAERLEVDVRDRPVRNVGQDNATPGRRVVLSLDAGLQRFVAERLRGRRGAVAAIEPSTGGVLALVSSPSFDASLFHGGISEDDYAMLRDDPAKPQINRAIAAAYAPGSTFKIITTLASQLAGQDPLQRVVNCPGYYSLGARHRVRCLGRHGLMGFDRAMTKSCNTFFASLAVKAGEERLREASRLVGLGERTGIDLLGERPGIVPTMEWIAKWRNPPVWYRGDTVNFGIGQGEISATPLQMAQVIALVANRGVAFRPRLVRAIVPRGANPTPIRTTPELSQRFEAPAEFWRSLHKSLFHVVEQGTGQRGRIAGFRWGGKTGSAENRRDAETHSWFVGFAPIDQPRIALAVLVENAGHGGEVAAPLAGEIVRRYLRGGDAEIEVLGSAKTVAANSSAREAAPASPNAR